MTGYNKDEEEKVSGDVCWSRSPEHQKVFGSAENCQLTVCRLLNVDSMLLRNTFCARCAGQTAAQIWSQRAPWEGEVYSERCREEQVASACDRSSLSDVLPEQLGRNVVEITDEQRLNQTSLDASIHHTHTGPQMCERPAAAGMLEVFPLSDEFLASALSLPAECVAASPPPPPWLSPLSTQSLHPSVLRQGPGRDQSAPRSVLWVLSEHTLVFGQQWGPVIYYVRPPNSQLGWWFSAGSELYHHKRETKPENLKTLNQRDTAACFYQVINYSDGYNHLLVKNS